jgi:hypothetical protein
MKSAKHHKEKKSNHVYQYKYSNRRIEIITTIIVAGTYITLNGQIKYILDVQMIYFMNLKANKYHKIGLKIVNHKDMLPTSIKVTKS